MVTSKLVTYTTFSSKRLWLTCILEIHLVSKTKQKPLLVKSDLFWLAIELMVANEFATYITFCFTSWTKSHDSNMRVWSWLRMNAGGVLNTCKSNEAIFYDPFGVTDYWLSGGRVSNAWVTYLVQGDNSWKRLLIPHKRTASHEAVWKVFSVQDGPASD